MQSQAGALRSKLQSSMTAWHKPARKTSKVPRGTGELSPVMQSVTCRFNACAYSYKAHAAKLDVRPCMPQPPYTHWMGTERDMAAMSCAHVSACRKSHLVADLDEQGHTPSSLISCDLGFGLVLNWRTIHSDILHTALPAPTGWQHSSKFSNASEQAC